MKAYRIKGWDKHYENNRSRELKRPEWLPLPNTFDGRGFMELMDHGAGMSHYGAWCLLLGAASRMPSRGTLLSDSGHPLSLKDVARMTRGSLKDFEEAMPRLLEIGWVELVEVESQSQDDVRSADSVVSSPEKSGRRETQDAETSQPGAGIPQLGANMCPLNGKGNMNMKENKNTPAAAAAVVGAHATPTSGDGARQIIQGLNRQRIQAAVASGDPLAVIMAAGGTRDEMRDAEWLRDANGMSVGELVAVFWIAQTNRRAIRQPSGLRSARAEWDALPVPARRGWIREAFTDLGIPMPTPRRPQAEGEGEKVPA